MRVGQAPPLCQRHSSQSGTSSQTAPRTPRRKHCGGQVAHSDPFGRQLARQNAIGRAERCSFHPVFRRCQSNRVFCCAGCSVVERRESGPSAYGTHDLWPSRASSLACRRLVHTGRRGQGHPRIRRRDGPVAPLHLAKHACGRWLASRPTCPTWSIEHVTHARTIPQPFWSVCRKPCAVLCQPRCSQGCAVGLRKQPCTDRLRAAEGPCCQVDKALAAAVVKDR